MPRLARLAPAATALALLVACEGDRAVTPPIGAPNAAILDGREADGNADFFWLPPVAANPTGEDFRDHAFNPNLRPRIEIIRTLDGAVVLERTPAGLVASEELYKLEWSTPPDAPAGTVYRVSAFLSATSVTPLGFVDLAPKENGVQNMSDGTVYEFREGRVVPLKMRIETNALCDDPASDDPCASETIIGAVGGEVVLGTGDRIVVPPQNDDGVQREFTLTLELCNDDPIDVDLPRFGNCLRATVEPPLVEEPAAEAETFSPFINVLICSLNPAADPTFGALSEEQEDLVTLYRQDDGDVFALPKSVASCPSPIGSLDLRNPMNLARAGWRALRDRVATWVAPQPLYASAVVLNTGGGGDSPFTSKFQLALPAKMDACNSTTCPEVSGSAPAVLVTDGDTPAQPVSGATVTFEVTGGTITGPDADEGRAGIQVITGTAGIAALDTWTPGATGPSTVTGSGRAIADVEKNGPKDGFDPFMPDISQPGGGTNVDPVNRDPILVDIGRVLFTSALSDLVIESFTHTPAEPTTVDLITFTAVVKNIGERDAGPSSLAFGIGGETFPRNFDVPALAPQATFTAQRELVLRSARGFINTATADAGRVIAESNEDNNVAQDDYIVTAVTPIFQATFTSDNPGTRPGSTPPVPETAPGSPEVGTWTINAPNGNTVLVRSAVGDLTEKPVELNQLDGATGGVDLIGTVAGDPPNAGVFVARWSSLAQSPTIGFAVVALRDANGFILASVEYRPEGFLTYNSGGIRIASFTPGVSQLFEVTIDFTSRTTSLSIDGTPIEGFQNVPFFATVTDLARISFETGGTSAQTFAWDHIAIF